MEPGSCKKMKMDLVVPEEETEQGSHSGKTSFFLKPLFKLLLTKFPCFISDCVDVLLNEKEMCQEEIAEINDASGTCDVPLGKSFIIYIYFFFLLKWKS